MTKEAVLHIPDSNYAFALDEQIVVIRIRVKKGDLKSCCLFYGDRAYDGKSAPAKKISMDKICSDCLFDYYQCRIKSGYTRIFYYFYLEDKSGYSSYYYSDVFHKTPECGITEYYQFAYVRREDIANVPQWASSAIIYQIFPDSFATGKRYISKEGLKKEAKSGGACTSKCGGTLNGITKNLDYLIDLGVNCIYLNPIFTASSYHKYDTVDYFSVDPCFGTEEDLKRLVSCCHENGIRVILDGVFNHCGSSFFAFQDVLKNGENSRYKNWFYRLEFPIKYECPPNYETFAYVREMPKLNTGNDEVAEYLCNVGTYWIKKADIDGWRLDVANEINHGFWRKFRKKVKTLKPEAILIGEIWEDAPQWLQGDQLDSTMNYNFSNLCRDFFAKRSISAEEFDQKLHAMILRYKTQIAYAQMNLLDSHDVPRFLSKCGGDVRKLKLALFFMMTFIGMPSIFYGDEAGIYGTTEQEYRKPMVWDKRPQECDLFRFTKKMIILRKQHKSLVYGSFRTVFADKAGVYAFTRASGKEKLLVVLNNSDTDGRMESNFKLSGPICTAFSDYKGPRSTGGIQNIRAMEGQVFEIL